MSNFLETTQSIERALVRGRLKFDLDNSPLGTLDHDFVPIYDWSFTDILSKISTENRSVMEIGGGPNQQAALDILAQFPRLDFTGLEVRTLKPKSRAIIEGYPHSRIIKAGVTRILDLFSEEQFALIFAHNVAESLPHPFEIINFLHDSILSQEGYLFINRIPVYLEVWEKYTQFLKSKGIVCGFRYGGEPSNLRKAGITYASLGLCKTISQLPFPLEAVGKCHDFLGNSLITSAYSFISPE
jgi:hypothetical protein